MDDLQEFHDAMEKVRERTLNEKENLESAWTEMRNLWGEHYNQIPDKLIRQRTRLLMAVRYTECLQGILWIEWLAMRGGYYQAIRELRSILESTVLAYYVDKEYHDLDVKGKLAVLKEMSSSGTDYGKKMIKKAKPPRTERILKIYDELSGFVHTSVDHLHKIMSTSESDMRIFELTTPQYDGHLLQQCYILTKQVVKLVIATNQSLIEALQ